MKRFPGGQSVEESMLPFGLVVIMALALQNLLLLLTLTHLASPGVMVACRALVRVAVLVLIGPVTS